MKFKKPSSYNQAVLSKNYKHKPLRDQVAIVTGASSGIGEGVARYLAAAGASVIINYRSEAKAAKEIVSDIVNAGGNATAIRADVSSETQVRTMFAKALNEFGTIDILVNNAGLQKDSPFPDMSLRDWKEVLDVNLTGQFLCAREAVRTFNRQSLRPSVSRALGKIIFMSSVHEVIPWAGHVNYAASKGGVMLLMKSIAQELAGQKIRVNSIGPGAIKTPINHSAWGTKKAESKLLKLIPQDRIGETDDIGRAAIWLASDESDYVNGTTLFIDGGMTLYPGFGTGG